MSTPDTHNSLLTAPQLSTAARQALSRAGLNEWAVRGHSDFTPVDATPAPTSLEGFDITEIAID